MSEVHGQAFYPGVVAVEQARYTLCHGITPGLATLRVQPQAATIAEHGDLVLTDGFRKVVVRDCKVQRLREERDESGVVWHLELLDRRWRWSNPGQSQISGVYNQLDAQGKLIPWTIRSPGELAALCLEAMGEAAYDLSLVPPGLAYRDGAGIQQLLQSGQNFAPTGTNPPVNWSAVPPAQALAQVADLFGLRVVYRVQTDSVLLTPPTVGRDLPTAGKSIFLQAPGLETSLAPDAVGVVGAPNKYQVRLRLEAVGEDWDGYHRPIDQLSYAPRFDGASQENTLTVSGVRAGATFTVSLGADPFGGPTADVTCAAGPGDTAATVAARLAALINSLEVPGVEGQLAAAAAGGALTVTGAQNGVPFFLEAAAAGQAPGEDGLAAGLTRVATPGDGTADWSYSWPPHFANVLATENLTYDEAVRLAQKSVFKCYRVVNVDVGSRWNHKQPIHVPGYGPLVRRQQLVLLPEMVRQVVPTPHDLTVQDVQTGREFTYEFYSGYSRSAPAVVYGAVGRAGSGSANGVWYVGAREDDNQNPWERVAVPFAVDPELQMITFSDHVFAWAENAVGEPKLVLETAAHVLDPDTNAPVRYAKLLPLPGVAEPSSPVWKRYEDVEAGYVGVYSPSLFPPSVHGSIALDGEMPAVLGEPWPLHRLQGVQALELDPEARADYYLRALALQYRARPGAQVGYNGIEVLDCDGLVQQVTWQVGEGGVTTTAYAGFEGDIWTPPYPRRRRIENLKALESNPQLFDPRRVFPPDLGRT